MYIRPTSIIPCLPVIFARSDRLLRHSRHSHTSCSLSRFKQASTHTEVEGRRLKMQGCCHVTWRLRRVHQPTSRVFPSKRLASSSFSSPSWFSSSPIALVVSFRLRSRTKSGAGSSTAFASYTHAIDNGRQR